MKLGSSVIQDKKVNTKQENGKGKKNVHFP